MCKGSVVTIGCLLSVLLGSVTGDVLVSLDFGTTLITGVATFIGFMGYMVTDSI